MIITWPDTPDKLIYNISHILHTQFINHCVRHHEEAAHHTILWEPTHGKSRRGAPCMKYVTLLKKDTGLNNTHEVENVMLCRETWSGVARCSRASTGWGEVKAARLLYTVLQWGLVTFWIMTYMIEDRSKSNLTIITPTIWAPVHSNSLYTRIAVLSHITTTIDSASDSKTIA